MIVDTNTLPKSNKVSVIMPAFNSEQTIARAIESVLGQTYDNFELIIIDDGSTDKTNDIIIRYKALDSRIIFLQNATNQGVGATRNIGIKSAVGNYIAFLDSDDEWLETKLEKQLALFKHKNTVLVCSHYKIFKDKNSKGVVRRPRARILINDLLRENVIGCSTAIYDVSKIGKHYMPLLKKRQDYAFWLKIISKYGPATCVQESLVNYHIQEGSISSNKIWLAYHNYLMFRKEIGFSVYKSLKYTIFNIYYKFKFLMFSP